MSSVEGRHRVAMAGHLDDAATARAGLVDGDPKVRSSALGALARLGVLDATTLTHTSYANVVTTNANRDEVALAFGLKTPGDPAQGVEVRLHTRIVMSPWAAKRLLERLNRMQDATVQHAVITP